MTTESTYQTEFPEFVLDVPIPEGWEDVSWHNDACPSWQFGDKQIFIDFPKGSPFRDMPCEDLKRFTVVQWGETSRLDDGESADKCLLTTDDFQEVLAFLAK